MVNAIFGKEGWAFELSRLAIWELVLFFEDEMKQKTTGRRAGEGSFYVVVVSSPQN